jgi:hypothetical protein
VACPSRARPARESRPDIIKTKDFDHGKAIIETLH